MINSYIGMTLRKLHKLDLKDKLDGWAKHVNEKPKEGELQECYQDEEFYLYINSQLYFVSRSTFSETGVECYSPYECVIENEFIVPDFEGYCVEVEIDPDWIASEEISNIGIESTIDKEILDEMIFEWLQLNTKHEKYLLLYSAGSSGPDYNMEYDSWYDFYKYVRLADL